MNYSTQQQTICQNPSKEVSNTPKTEGSPSKTQDLKKGKEN